MMKNFDLFDFDYKCDFPDWKKEIEKAIIDEYYFQEIGQETADRFKHVFRTKLQKIMPYYNDLYTTTKNNFDPFVTEDITETIAGGSASTLTDYPQSVNPADDIPTAKTRQENTATRNTKGYSGMNYPQRLKEYRETILRITAAIVNEMRDCFLLVY